MKNSVFVELSFRQNVKKSLPLRSSPSQPCAVCDSPVSNEMHSFGVHPCVSIYFAVLKSSYSSKQQQSCNILLFNLYRPNSIFSSLCLPYFQVTLWRCDTLWERHRRVFSSKDQNNNFCVDRKQSFSRECASTNKTVKHHL